MSLLPLFEDMLKLEYEICGVLKLDETGKIKEIDIQSIGGTDFFACQHTSYAKYIFHTHPHAAKSYPSAEDIVKVLKNRNIAISVIFSQWGIWTIHSKRKAETSEKQKKEQVDILNKLLAPLYFATNKGRATSVSAPLVHKLIRPVMERYSEFGLDIVLTPWSEADSFKILL